MTNFVEGERGPIELAQMLVSAAKVHAISSFVPLLDRFPELKSVKPTDWDFFMTVAGAGTAFATITDCVPAAHQVAVSNLIAQDLENWNSDGHRALLDLVHYLKKADGSGIEPPLALGSWVLMNVKQSTSLTDDEYQRARVIGVMLLEGFLGWFRSGQHE